MTTRKGDKVYVHVLNWPDEELFVPVTGEKVVRAARFADGSRLTFRQDDAGVTVRLGERDAQAPDFIVELTVGK